MENPRPPKARATSSPAGLSRSARDKNTVPVSGSRVPDAIWLLAKAKPKVMSTPITSPVERISGPSSVSTPGKRSKGSTASLTLTWSSTGTRPMTSGARRPSWRRSARLWPTITRAATMARGTPVALATNGTVRLARGLASST